jgi:hypothetical protein
MTGTPAPGPVAPGPVAGVGLWRQVIGRAGLRCECRGGCGLTHASGQGRCIREDAPWARLHAVPRDPAAHGTAAAALPASALHALCGPCDAALSSIHARARKAAHGALSAAERLF